jgi:hypothetical protein
MLMCKLRPRYFCCSAGMLRTWGRWMYDDQVVEAEPRTTTAMDDSRARDTPERPCIHVPIHHRHTHKPKRTTSWMSLRVPSRVSDLTRAYVCRISIALRFVLFVRMCVCVCVCVCLFREGGIKEEVIMCAIAQ